MAQRPTMEEIKEKMLADKVAYLTARLSLTIDEAEKFWPVYNDFIDKRTDIQMSYYGLERILNNRFRDRDKENESDEEITKAIKEYFAKKQEEEALNAKYYERFLKILPPKKVQSLYQAEKDYINYLNLRNRGGNRNNVNIMNR